MHTLPSIITKGNVISVKHIISKAGNMVTSISPVRNACTHYWFREKSAGTGRSPYCRGLEIIARFQAYRNIREREGWMGGLLSRNLWSRGLFLVVPWCRFPTLLHHCSLFLRRPLHGLSGDVNVRDG